MQTSSKFNIMINSNLSRIILYGMVTALLAASGASCSIKEDRWPCPCHLIFRPGESTDINSPGGFTATVFNKVEKELSAELSWREVRVGDYDVAVSKGEKIINITTGTSNAVLSGTRLLIAKGRQADSIYSSTCNIFCLEEEAEVPVELYKQFSTVFLSMMDGGEVLPYRIRIRGFVEGMDMLDLKPVLGEYFFEPEATNSNCSQFQFRLPRQIPDLASELVMEIWKKADGPDGDEVLMDRLPLGTLILQAHHDWEKQSLEDIHIGIDYTRSIMQININDWTAEWTEKIEI